MCATLWASVMHSQFAWYFVHTNSLSCLEKVKPSFRTLKVLAKLFAVGLSIGPAGMAASLFLAEPLKGHIFQTNILCTLDLLRIIGHLLISIFFFLHSNGVSVSAHMTNDFTEK